MSSTYNFTKYITTAGTQNLSPETNYTIAIVHDEKIVQSQNITTAAKKYVSEMNVYFKNNLINISFSTDDSFQDFDTLLIQVENLTDSTWGPRRTGIDWTTGTRETIFDGTFAFPVIKTSSPQTFEVKIYCRTTDPEKKSLPDTKVVTDEEGQNPEYYYFIYTYDKPIVLEGE